MAVKIYMDVHIPKSITNGLLVRNVDVLTAQEDNTTKLPDNELLDRANELERVMISFDKDMLFIANQCAINNKSFSGLIYAHPLQITIGECVKA